MKNLNFDADDLKKALAEKSTEAPEPVATLPAVNRLKVTRTPAANTLKKMVLGREVVFKREVIEAGNVEKNTNVFNLNERAQDLLNEYGVADILPGIKKDKINSFEAYARPHGEKRELADGSRRRRACILGKAALAMWVAELSDREMEYLSESGNQHKQASVYERGLVYERWIEEGRYTSARDIAREKKISDRTVRRCLEAAKLPRWLISAYKTPNDMSVESAGRLYYAYTNKTIDIDVLKKRAEGSKISWTHPQYSGAEITTNLLKPVINNIKDHKPIKPRWLIKDQIKISKVKDATRFDVTGLDEEKQKKLEFFMKELMKK